MQTRILVADDNAEIREIIRILLNNEGYEVIEAMDGNDVLEKFDSTIDLIILDIMMPNMNGYQTCLKVREISNVPILFLTAKGLDSDKTLGFSSGADDYLSKPFSYSELTARVKALLRRYQVYKGKDAITKPDQQDDLVVDGVILRASQGTVEIDGKEIELTDIEFNILNTLMQNPKQIFSASDLYEKVWNEPYFYSANNTIMVHIRNLRKKIEKDPANPAFVKTIWGKGYRFE
jgi:two-component system, OmpR family, response regulator